MELRFLEGNFEHGRFKLQYREKHPSAYIKGDTMDGPWLDVPSVKSPKDVWCEHIVKGDFGKDWEHSFGHNRKVPSCWKMCPICGKERP